MITESHNIKDYIKKTDVIDFDYELIIDKCSELKLGTKNDIELIEKVYKYVRDEIHHSGDIGAQEVTCKASEVLEYGHGICCAKSHLLTAMLRFFEIPTGFCYQKLCAEDSIRKVLHGLNAVYIKSTKRWLRLDARGNKEGVDAQFCLETEKIAWPVNKAMGEEDHPTIFVDPNKQVVKVLQMSKDRKELWAHWELALGAVFEGT